jgi:hypothetical protein
MPEQDLQEIVRGVLDKALEFVKSEESNAEHVAARLGRAVVADPQGDHHALIKDVHGADERHAGMKFIMDYLSRHIAEARRQ